jgi:hypothetical protein
VIGDPMGERRACVIALRVSFDETALTFEAQLPSRKHVEHVTTIVRQPILRDEG